MKGKLALLTLLVLAFILRGITAPAQQPKAQAAPETSEAPQRRASTPFKQMASTAFNNGVRGAIYARAVYLYQAAQKQQNAEQWLSDYYNRTAGDVGFIKQQYGSPVGDAEQFNQTLGRSAELASVSLALDWMMSSSPRLDRAAVNLDPVLDSYNAIKGAK